MDIQYDLMLIIVALLASCLAVFVTFNFIEHLYHCTVAKKLPFLITYSVAVGCGLWGIHCINILAFHRASEFSFINLPMLASWLTALFVGYNICNTASKKLMSISTLIYGAAIVGMGSYLMFYLGMMGISNTLSILNKPTFIAIYPLPFVAALLVAIGVSAISLTGLSWLKDYAGQNKLIIKLILAFVTAFAILSAHIAFNASLDIDTTLVAHVNKLLGDKKLLGIIVALSLVCMFLLVFVLVLYYEKHGVSTFRFSVLDTKHNVDPNSHSYKDALTHLPNRRGFNHYLKTAIKRCQRIDSTLALAYIDLDHFKPINDNFGHHVGDALLVAVAERLSAAVRGCDVVARIGGDEFTAIIDEIKDDEDITTIIERIVSSIKEPFFVANHRIEISCSVGVAVFPLDGDIDKLMVCADAAMYKAKENGKNQFKFFDSQIELASDQMLEMQHDLRLAIEKNQFSLAYQPKLDCKTQLPIGAEALIRWNHPTKGIINPKDFIPAAERFGLINQISDWVIEESCRAMKRAIEAGINLDLSINLASQQFRNPNLVAEIINQTDKYSVPRSRLIFEIKETNAIKNEALFNNLLAQFKAANMRVALDDFGSHPFTLSYLQNLTVDEIKLDKLFVASITDDKSTWKLVDILISLAHSLNLNVVAEGVETNAQKEALVELGCNHMQGYLFAKPLSEEKLFRLLKDFYISFDSPDQFSMTNYDEIAA